jgi:hypothetical protein
MTTAKQHHTTIKSELKSLGTELSTALKHVRDSEEVATLKRNVTQSAKTLAADVEKAVRAAYASASAQKLKKEVGRLAAAGKKEGLADLHKAAVFARKEVRVARRKLGAIAKRFKSKASKPKSSGKSKSTRKPPVKKTSR